MAKAKKSTARARGGAARRTLATRVRPAKKRRGPAKTASHRRGAARRFAPEDRVFHLVDPTLFEVTTDPKKTEVTALASAISIAMLVVGGALSLVWFGRLV